jgi:hypothetical protein
MDFRNIAKFLEERRDDKQPFTLYYARISKDKKLLCSQFKMQIKSDYGWPILEFVDKKGAKDKGYASIRISTGKDNEINNMLDCIPRAIGRTKQEALQCLKNSLQYKIELRKKDIEKAKSIIKNSEDELKLVDEQLKTE